MSRSERWPGLRFTVKPASSRQLAHTCTHRLHIVDYGAAEFRALQQLLVAFHQTLKVVRDRLVGDGAVHALRVSGMETNGGADEQEKEIRDKSLSKATQLCTLIASVSSGAKGEGIVRMFAV